jgi:predicted Abi (CAAX) family protease
VTTVAEIEAAWQKVMCTPLFPAGRASVHPLQELADDRAIDREIARRTDAEMDGAAADYVARLAGEPT